jgi:transcriptional regulator with XRE-family HTH domain
VEARKERGLSQKELASKILLEGGGEISVQYLNDIEHDRRNPTAPHLIKEFARVLGLDGDYLSFLAGQFPDNILRKKPDPDRFQAAWRNFRKDLDRSKR